MIFGKRPPRAVRRHLESTTVPESSKPNGDELGSQIIRTPPMKPFARTTGTPAPVPKPAPRTQPAAPSRPPTTTRPAATPSPKPQHPASAVAQPARRAALPNPRQGPDHVASHTLVVGRDIRLTGEISACQRLIVEGSVEAELTDTHTLEIADTGQFRGSAVVGDCIVSGSFDGELTVTGLLAVRAGGRVGGAIRYAEIEVERGGRITGRADLQGPQEVRDTTRPAESRPAGGLGLRPA
ncbi:MAG: polymer-forming cytoskeletal protein [Alphaproteobacteria bacterium]